MKGPLFNIQKEIIKIYHEIYFSRNSKMLAVINRIFENINCDNFQSDSIHKFHKILPLMRWKDKV